MSAASTMVTSDRALELRPEEPAVAEFEPSSPPPVAGESLEVGIVLRRGLRVIAAAVVAFVVFALWLSGLAQARSQVGLQRGFRAELASAQAPVGGAIPAGAPVAIVEIPRLHLHEAVVEGARSGQLREGPGHVVGTPLPGQPGNAVLAGRHTMYGGPFGHLGALRAGDGIDITTGQGRAAYRVVGVAQLASSDGSFVQDHSDNRLTLFTSASRWSASSRLVVSATLVGDPFPATALRRTLDPDGLGLTGERGAASYTLVWLELLAVGALMTVFAATRWSTMTTWVVFTPVLAFALWLFLENAARLLPATL